MRIHLVRHASNRLIETVLCGRTVEIGLDEIGRRQAYELASMLSTQRIDLVQASPRRRARETAQPIAARLGCDVEIVPALDELDAGAWSGRTLEALECDERWQHWNAARGSSRPPGGESMRELQCRVLAHLEMLAAMPIEAAVLVSHAEPIRAALMHFRGIPLDDFHHVAVAPASVSSLDVVRRSEPTMLNEVAVA
jgi:broad specificity phosphatase PhoE